MNASYRLKRSLRTQGVCFGLGFAASVIFAAWIAATAPNVPNRLAAVVVLAGVPLAMTGLSAWMLAAYYRERLTMQGDRIVHEGVVGRKEIDITHVVEARWRIPLPGGIVLRDASTRLSISFSNYEDDDVDRIVGHLQSTLPPQIQFGWNLFAYRSDACRARKARTKPGPDEILADRRRWDRLFAPVLVLALITGAASGWIRGRPSDILISLLAVLSCWILFRTMTPAQGTVVRKLSRATDPETCQILTLAAAAIFFGIAGLVAVSQLRPRLNHPDAVTIIWSLACFAIFMVEGQRLERRRAIREREAADAAAKVRSDAVDESAWSQI
jgi:hypothetical protein